MEKKPGIFIMYAITAGLCVVLLAMAYLQNREIRDLRLELTEIQASLAEEVSEPEEPPEEVPEPEEETPLSVRFRNARIVPEARVLFVDIVVESPGGDLPFTELGLCLAGEPYSLAWKQTYLSRETNGTYTQTLSFPLNEDMELDIRLGDDTVLFSGSVGMLLPLRRDYGGGTWHFDEHQHIFYITDLSARLIDPEGKEVPVQDGTFCFCRNGKRVLLAHETESGRLVDENGELFNYSLSIPCAPGDHIRIDYTCRDETGLRWDFPLTDMEALEWGDMRRWPLSGWPEITWPE